MTDEAKIASSIGELYKLSSVLLERACAEMRLPRDRGYDVGADAVRVLTALQDHMVRFSPEPSGSFSAWLARPCRTKRGVRKCNTSRSDLAARPARAQASVERSVLTRLNWSRINCVDSILRRFEARAGQFLRWHLAMESRTTTTRTGRR
jgi:hypothetical protein